MGVMGVLSLQFFSSLPSVACWLSLTLAGAGARGRFSRHCGEPFFEIVTQEWSQ